MNSQNGDDLYKSMKARRADYKVIQILRGHRSASSKTRLLGPFSLSRQVKGTPIVGSIKASVGENL
jgi:hypothetical protein